MSFSLLLPLVQLLLPLQPFTLCCSLLLLLHRTSCVRAWAKFILSSSIAGSFSCMWVVLLLLRGASSSCSWSLFLLLRGFSFEVSHLLSFLIWWVLSKCMLVAACCCSWLRFSSCGCGCYLWKNPYGLDCQSQGGMQSCDDKE